MLRASGQPPRGGKLMSVLCEVLLDIGGRDGGRDTRLRTHVLVLALETGKSSGGKLMVVLNSAVSVLLIQRGNDTTGGLVINSRPLDRLATESLANSVIVNRGDRSLALTRVGGVDRRNGSSAAGIGSSCADWVGRVHVVFLLDLAEAHLPKRKRKGDTKLVLYNQDRT